MDSCLGWEPGKRASGPQGPWDFLTEGTHVHAKRWGGAALVPLLTPFLPSPSRMIQGRSVSQLPEQMFTRPYSF